MNRRYRDFVWLYGQLNNNNPGIVVPPPPEKQQIGTPTVLAGLVNARSISG